MYKRSASNEDNSTAVGVGTGALTAGLTRLLLRRALEKRMMRQDPKFTIPTLGQLSVDAARGTGEARMATNMAKRLNDWGYNTTYLNVQAPDPWEDIYAHRIKTPESQAGRQHLSEELHRIALTDPSRLSGDVIVEGVPETQWKVLLDKAARFNKAKSFGKKGFNAVEELISGITSGRFNDFRVGELRDSIALLNDRAISGETHMTPWAHARVLNPAADDAPGFGVLAVDGRIPHAVFSGERGMYDSTSAWNRNLVSDPVVGNEDQVRRWLATNGATFEDPSELESIFAHGINPQSNLSRQIVFQSNLDTDPLHPSKHPITGMAIETAPWYRSRHVQRIRHKVNSIATKNFLYQNNPNLKPGDLANKKIIFISGGSAGPGSPETLLRTLRATRDMPNVHIVAQLGANTLGGKGLFNANRYSTLSRDIERVLAETGGLGRVTLLDRVPYDMQRKLYNGSDLNIGYSGSSTAHELMGASAPVIPVSDLRLNRGNANGVHRIFGNSERLSPIHAGDSTLRWRLNDTWRRLHGRDITDADFDNVPEIIRAMREPGGLLMPSFWAKDDDVKKLIPGVRAADIGDVQRQFDEKIRFGLSEQAANEAIERAARASGIQARADRASKRIIDNTMLTRFRRTPAGRRLGRNILIGSAAAGLLAGGAAAMSR